MNSDKKVLITTVYNSENCGSYLQAWSLYHVLKMQGYEVAFLRRGERHTSHSFGLHLSNAMKDLVKFRFSHAYYIIKEWFVFNKLHGQFEIVRKDSSFFREALIQIIGSDTLWNFEVDYFRNRVKLYLGQEFLPKSSITYAVSAANTSSELFSNTVKSVADQRGIIKYLVRDTHTACLVKTILNEESKIVCDPTMLLNANDFESLEKEKPSIEHYLLIYCFGDIASMKDAIISYAKNRGLKTVSLLSRRDWCDYSVEEDPQLMVTFYRYATCVVSNTFHGTAFSMIYEKPFAVLDEGKIKVKELLGLYEQEQHLIQSPESLADCLDAVLTDREKQIYESIKQQSLALLINTVNNEINREV